MGIKLAVNLYFLLCFHRRWWDETLVFFNKNLYLAWKKAVISGKEWVGEDVPLRRAAKELVGFRYTDCCPLYFLLCQLMWPLDQYDSGPVPKSLVLDQTLTQKCRVLLWKAHMQNFDAVMPKNAMKVTNIASNIYERSLHFSLFFLFAIYCGVLFSKENKKNGFRPCFSWADTNRTLWSGSLLPRHTFLLHTT